MNDKKYRYALVLISLVILATLVIQVYWNYKNYEEARRQLISDVQISLDQSVDQYFTQRAKENTMGIFSSGGLDSIEFDSLTARIDASRKDGFYSFSSIDTKDFSSITVVKGGNMDTLNKIQEGLKDKMPRPMAFPILSQEILADGDSLKINRNRTFQDTIYTSIDDRRLALREDIKNLTTKIVVSITDDKIDTKRLYAMMDSSLQKKRIEVPFVIGTIDKKANMTTQDADGKVRALAQSGLMKNDQQVFVEFSNLPREVLKRNLTGILLSLLLISGVIFCLFYLLQVIRNQKELSEMKNDLISNITHEFKTPIATTAAALEGVQNFTSTGDSEKTRRYLSMGQDQLKKLNGMVEKLLETATLDSSDLNLQMGQVELAEIIENLVLRHTSQTDKKIRFELKTDDTELMGDAFHLENAINNLLDNAVKYGGDEILVSLDKKANELNVSVSDSGTGLSSKEAKMIFDKFYRVAQGNKHNVKGFGIGLFYTKSIIDKHGGTIEVDTKPTTTFKITLPDGK
jgi:two-component system phosphate regulon sensor histidine kinase PhoR